MHTSAPNSAPHGVPRSAALILLLIVLGLCQRALAAQEFILLQSTTSTQSSGLFDYLLPQFTAAHGIEVRVVAVGSGQALKNAAEGNADVVLVHAEAAEEAFVAAGHGLAREPVMYNEFVIVGPVADQADVAAVGSATDAMARIAERRAVFLSRGDASGTHDRERQLWQAAGVAVDPATASWYRDAGSGMDRTLRIAAEIDAYTLCDRASWIAAPYRGTLAVLVENDAILFNQYSLILVNPARHPQVKAAAARTFVDWMRGPAGQRAIAAFRRHGTQLFFPNALDTD
jgi:tungstate transport system substrate-binding protein